MTQEIQKTFLAEVAEKSSLIERDGICGLHMLHVEIPQVNVDGKISLLALQSYDTVSGEVQPHKEPPGVDEYYFPIIGAFQVQVGQEFSILSGTVDPDKLSLDSQILTEESDGTLVLTLTTLNNQDTKIIGTKIPSGTVHGTKAINPEQAVWLAVKIDRNH